MNLHRHVPKRKPDPEVSDLHLALQAEIKNLTKIDRAMAAIVEAWETCMPKGLQPTFDRIAGRGVLIVKIASASSRFLASHALRCGGEAEIIRVAKGRVRTVKVEAGA